MKALPLHLLAAASLLSATTSFAAEPTPDAAPAAAEPAVTTPAAVEDAPTPPPARIEVPAATDPAAPPMPQQKADPALDLVPTTPGQIAPEPTLIPENPTGGSRPPGSSSALPTPKRKSRTEIAEADLALRIRLRQAQTRAMEDPKVQAEWNKSFAVRTDGERREAMTNYYNLLYGRMIKLDPAIATLAKTRQALLVNRLRQTRVSPTEALDAAESKRQGYITAEQFGPDQF